MHILAISLIVAILGFTRRKSRFVSVLIIVWLWVLMGFNTMNADYLGNQFLYDLHANDVQGAGLNIGYVATESVGWALGLSYIQYRQLFSIIGILLQYDLIRRYVEPINCVLVLYMILPFLYDVVQFKFFLAASVALWSLRYVIDGGGLRLLGFVLGIGIATTIHPAVAAFGLFIIGRLEKRRAIALSLCLTIIIVTLIYTGLLTNAMARLVDSVKAETYFSGIGRFGFIPLSVSNVFIVVLSNALWNEYNRLGDGNNEVLSIREQRCASFIRFFSTACLALLPISALQIMSLQNFYRIIRSSLILFYMYIVLFLWGNARTRITRQGAVLAFGAMFVWLIITFYLVFSGVWEIVVMTELNNNSLLYG